MSAFDDDGNASQVAPEAPDGAAAAAKVRNPARNSGSFPIGLGGFSCSSGGCCLVWVGPWFFVRTSLGPASADIPMLMHRQPKLAVKWISS